MPFFNNSATLAGTSAGAAVQGSPVNAVAWLANTLGRLGIGLKAGEIILSGSQSPLVPVKAGDSLRCDVGGLGAAGHLAIDHRLQHLGGHDHRFAGAAAAAAGAFTVAVPPGGTFDFPAPIYAGDVSAAWSSATGSASGSFSR